MSKILGDFVRLTTNKKSADPLSAARRGRPVTGSDPSAPRILAAAREVFATHGYEGASLRAITVQAQVDVAMVARAFGSKLGLWKAVVDDIAERVLPLLDAICAGPKEELSREILDQRISKLIDLVANTPFLAQFVVVEFVRDCERSVHIYERLALPIHKSIGRLVSKLNPTDAAQHEGSRFLAMSLLSALAIFVATRPMMTRIQPAYADDRAFKKDIKRMILRQFGLADRQSV